MAPVMPPSSPERFIAQAKDRAILNFLFFLKPRTSPSDGKKPALSAEAKKRRDAVQDLIYPWRAKSGTSSAREETSVADESKATRDDGQEKGKSPEKRSISADHKGQ